MGLPDRRQLRTAPTDSFRPATSANCSINFDDMRLLAGETASDMTCGSPLAGNPVSAVRQKRSIGRELPSATQDNDMDIRELLRRYQTYTQPSCIPQEELRSRKLEADLRRPTTPDVRIHTPLDRRRSQEQGRQGQGKQKGVFDVPKPTMKTSNGEALLLDE